MRPCGLITLALGLMCIVGCGAAGPKYRITVIHNCLERNGAAVESPVPFLDVLAPSVGRQSLWASVDDKYTATLLFGRSPRAAANIEAELTQSANGKPFEPMTRRANLVIVEDPAADPVKAIVDNCLDNPALQPAIPGKKPLRA